ncbi:uncharacterized protein LOC128952258 [Oppia nitens]|uniref:uncharacterized protein LOC128952258 n=1 Tax=Oppia nitens TaxID=1686743 RepID=UPI0023DAB4BF|nr:uncharacterized protein LOC128952258 [Oppia nitens]
MDTNTDKDVMTTDDDNKQQTKTTTQVKKKVPKSADYWDKLAKELDEEEDKVEDQDPNALFRQLYRNSDDDTRRAMMKSMVESNGTSLSMNWKEVGNKKVEPYKCDEDSDDDKDKDSDDK